MKKKTSKDKEITKLNNGNTLDKFFNMKKTIQEKDQYQNVPKHIKIPMSSGVVPQLYPHEPTFIYPKNPQFREYQCEISIQCIRFNTLVCLPTGLGKTHIASILITNFTLWFPKGKIFFLAPTRPLVRQQRMSLKWFYEKIGYQNVFQMNGQLPGTKRQLFYKTKKIFFCTPQTFENDLKQKRINAKQIVLIIFDQAHRAVGNSSYSQIVRQLNKIQLAYRTIGLSATPGNQQQKIQQVIANLNISKMVYKDQEDKDVKKYFHTKEIIPVIIQQPSIIKEANSLLDNIILPYVQHLIGLRLVDGWILRNKSFNSGIFFVIMQTFNERKQTCAKQQISYAYNSLKIIKFLTDSKKDLLQHGYETFKSKFFRKIQQVTIGEQVQVVEEGVQKKYDIQIGLKNKSKSKGKKTTKIEIKKQQKKSSSFINQNLPKKFREKLIDTQTYQRLKQLFNPKSNISSHPKLQKLKQILENFFKQSHQKEVHQKEKPSKVIVFTQFRATAVQIKKYLDSSKIIISQLFHGQSKTTYLEDVYTDEGEYSSSIPSTLFLNQKAQIGLIEKFKLNQINTLIATSIGEEGLDIGQVDCIVCYDGGNKSPIRTIQRFGRTGRKRQGLVYILLMEGSQENDFKKGKQKIKKMKEMLKNNKKFNYYGFNPSLLQQNSEVPLLLYDNKMMEQQKQSKIDLEEKKTKKRAKSKKSQTSNIDDDIETTYCENDESLGRLLEQKQINRKRKSVNKQKKTKKNGKKQKKQQANQEKSFKSQENQINSYQSVATFQTFSEQLQSNNNLIQQNKNTQCDSNTNYKSKNKKDESLKQISWQIGFIDQLYTQQQQESEGDTNHKINKHILNSSDRSVYDRQNSQNNKYKNEIIETIVDQINQKIQEKEEKFFTQFQENKITQIETYDHDDNTISNKLTFIQKLEGFSQFQFDQSDKYYQINRETQKKQRISQLLRQIIEEQEKQCKQSENQYKDNDNAEIQQLSNNLSFKIKNQHKNKCPTRKLGTETHRLDSSQFDFDFQWCFQSQKQQQQKQEETTEQVYFNLKQENGNQLKNYNQKVLMIKRQSDEKQQNEDKSDSSICTQDLDSIIQRIQMQSLANRLKEDQLR